MSLLLMIGLATAASIVLLGSYFGIQRALRPWVERDGLAPLAAEIRTQYGRLVQIGFAGASAVRQDHRTACRAFRRQVLVDSVCVMIVPYTVVLIWLLVAALIDFRQ